MKRHLIRFSKLAFVVSLMYVIILIGGFFGVRYGLTNTAGVVDQDNQIFDQNEKYLQSVEKNIFPEEKAEALQLRQKNFCRIDAIGAFYPLNAKSILSGYVMVKNDIVTAKMILAVKLRFLDNNDFISRFDACEQNSGNDSVSDLENKYGNAEGTNVFPWMNDEEWSAIKEATKKDSGAIARASMAAGVEPRLLVSCMIVEQLRLFHSEREIFKKFFGPLKILGNANKISLGVMGIKEATAAQIKSHLKDPDSEYYLGKNYENILDNLNGSAYDQLTSENDNHYASYLYGALYLKEMLSQWKDAGYDIQYRPEIVGTLFNVGFPQSKPNPNPKVGGSAINVGDAKYSFGSLAYEFYYSGEMLDGFPYVIK